MVLPLIQMVRFIGQLITVLVIVQVILTYVLDPYHPLRVAIDRLVEPMLRPIRRVVPLVGMFDFSALVLVILVQLFEGAIVGLLLMLLR